MRLPVLVLLGLLFMGGCSDAGDPGGKGLSELSADPVFAVQPPQATNVHKDETQSRREIDAAAGFSPPTVDLTFTSSASPEEIYGFYQHEAAAAGWRPGESGVFGTDQWTKRYGKDGTPGHLTLTRTGASDEYTLSGWIEPAAR
jgi:hypothetical protein